MSEEQRNREENGYIELLPAFEHLSCNPFIKLAQFNHVVNEKDFSVTLGIHQLSSSMLLGDVIKFLWGGKSDVPSDRIWEGNDSILQIPLWIGFGQVPRSVYMQIATHRKKDFFYPWCASARPDRDSKAAKEYSREQPVKFVMIFSAKAAIEISHLRLCNKAEEPTRLFVRDWKKVLELLGDKASVMTARQMMPMCAYRNGLCTEQRGCGHPISYAQGKRGEF